MRTKTSHITPVGGNVFADLGFTPREAAALKLQSQRIIGQKLATKSPDRSTDLERIKAQPVLPGRHRRKPRREKRHDG